MNGMSVRMGFALALLAAALLAGLYLSGVFTLFLLDLDIPLTWETYPRYVRALAMPEMQPFADKVWLAGAWGFGLPVSAWVVGAFFLLRYVPHARSASRAVPVQRMAAPAQFAKADTYYDQHLRAMSARSLRGPETEEADMKHAQAVAAAASLALAACATPSNSRLAQKALPAAHSAETGTPAIAANPAEELGQKLLKLIDHLETIDDLTPEKVEMAMMVKLLPGKKAQEYYFNAALTDQWWYSVSLFPNINDPNKGYLEMSFDLNSIKPGEYPSMSPVCIDVEEYSKLLESRGFIRSPGLGVDGGRNGWEFTRTGRMRHRQVWITIFDGLEFPDRLGNTGRRCVQAILLR